VGTKPAPTLIFLSKRSDRRQLMSSLSVSFVTLAFISGGTLLGMALRSILPEPHLLSDSKDAVRVGMGLVTTMAAMVLGLLIASAKLSYDTQNIEVTEMSSKVILLDRVLSHYGAKSKDARNELRNSVIRALDRLRSKKNGDSQLELASTDSEVLYDKIQALSPADDVQRSTLSQASGLVISLGQTRWLMYEQRNNSVSLPLLIVLIFWLTALFISFGLLAPRNATVVTSLLIAAISVSGAIFLILEMYTPYDGLIRISTAPLRATLAHLGQ
jgi:hypothetical protein